MTTTGSRLGAFAIAAAACLGADDAGAEPAIEEIAHDIAVDLHADRATMTVRRTLKTAYTNPQEAHLGIRTPAPTVARSLRTQGTDGRWYRADMMPVQHAVDVYNRLTGSEVEALVRDTVPQDPVLLMWSPEGFEVRAYPVVEHHPKTFEYVLESAYEYTDGAFTLAIPVGDASDLVPRVRIHTIARGHSASVGSTPIAPGDVLSELPEGDLTVRVVPDTPPGFGVRLDSTPAGDRHLARIIVQGGPSLALDPAGTHAVIVIDRSRSVGSSGIDAAKRAALGYLDALLDVPDAAVEVIGFDRELHEQHGGFVTPSRARESLHGAQLELKNGSDLRAALVRAGELLRAAPASAPKRVIVLSDAIVDPKHEASLRAVLAGIDATVHVADLQSDYDAWLEVAPDHRFAELVAKRGGVAWTGEVSPDADDETVEEMVAKWVRPTSIAGVVLTIDGVARDAFDLPVGHSETMIEVFDRAPRRVTATARVWGRSITAHAGRTKRGDRTWKLLAPAHGIDLTDDELFDVSVRAGAVSPVAALLALEPNAEPSDAELAIPDRSEWTVRSSGCGVGMGAPGSLARYSLGFDEPSFIADAVAQARSACGADASASTVELTTSYAEVIAITNVDVGADATASACVADRLWDLEFPPGRHDIVDHVIELPAQSST